MMTAKTPFLKMTTHGFARKLLLGPNIPIAIPRVIKYSEDDHCVDPVVCEADSEDCDGNISKIALISHALVD